ncbi:PAS domain-containing protein [Hymenobacter cellulosilyticus]|uniref:PAS domain-containing protein n=1 Tax=Hymenobacter cellulosilyticus TaxID=2932248 RepID=A0A8T9Q5B5_9BACT|nr:PAS domain-containing protein [Hymenobacter cellulosilyticus]UOQ72707.1 PAS domain-containing protein [Hymenobacter cellulosilyticus]
MREQQLQSILRHMPAGIATLLGPELRYGFVNEAMQALLGGDTPEGQPLANHLGVLAADLLEVMQQVYKSGRPYVAKAYALPLLDAAGARPRLATLT